MVFFVGGGGGGFKSDCIIPGTKCLQQSFEQLQRKNLNYVCRQMRLSPICLAEFSGLPTAQFMYRSVHLTPSTPTLQLSSQFKIIHSISLPIILYYLLEVGTLTFPRTTANPSAVLTPFQTFKFCPTIINPSQYNIAIWSISIY